MAKKNREWIEDWARKNGNLLVGLELMYAAVHPEHGIVNVGRTLDEALAQARFLKKSVLRDVFYVNVSKTLSDIRPKRKVYDSKKAKKSESIPQLQDPLPDPHNGLPDTTPLSPPYDPFDTEALIDGASAGYRRHLEEQQTTLVAYAQKKGLKATEVLMKLLTWGAEGVHINSKLDEETVRKLDAEFDPPIVNVQTPTSESLPRNAVESPHKQPPFQPRHAPFDRGVLLDGYGRSLARGLGRID